MSAREGAGSRAEWYLSLQKRYSVNTIESSHLCFVPESPFAFPYHASLTNTLHEKERVSCRIQKPPYAVMPLFPRAQSCPDSIMPVFIIAFTARQPQVLPL